MAERQRRSLRDLLEPTYVVHSLADIHPRTLTGNLPGIRGVAIDVDKTIVGQEEMTIPDEHLAVLVAIQKAGLALGFISNANSKKRSDRVGKLAEIVRAESRTEVPYVTSGMVGNKKKPKRPIYDEMSRRLGSPNETNVGVGDQLFKDVLGANLAGYAATYLVAPYGEGDDPRVRYLQRPAEAVARLALGMPLLASNFPTHGSIEH